MMTAECGGDDERGDGRRADDEQVDAGPSSTTRQRGPKRAEVVVNTVLAYADLFHDENAVAFATIATSKREETVKVRSRAMRLWIAWRVRAQEGEPVSTSVIEQAVLVLEGIAIHERPEQPAHLRLASYDGGEICLDLATESGDVVRVASGAWNVTTSSPVKFVRPGAMRALPRPVRGGTVGELRPFLNVDDDGFALVIAWLLAALRPGYPYPILAFYGEHGTGKSTAARVVRSLVDPSRALARAAPRNEDDLAVSAVNSHVIALDNLSGMPPWLSDSLCRLATGSGLAKRTLYSDDEETVLDAKKPVIVNGIDDLANRADLEDRMLLIELEPIPPEARRDENRFWTAFNTAAPRILAGLLDGIVAAQKAVDEVTLTEPPRMADFARWVTAAEIAVGWAAGTFMAAYHRKRAMTVDAALDASTVACAIRDLLGTAACRGTWQGTHKDLLAALDKVTREEIRRGREWPRTPHHLSTRIRRNKSFLEEAGVSITRAPHGRGAEKRERLTLTLVNGSEPKGEEVTP